MKLKFLGAPRRDGTYPTLVIEGESVTIEDGFVEVREGLEGGLLKTGNFKLEQGSIPAAPAAPEIPAGLGVSVALLNEGAAPAAPAIPEQPPVSNAHVEPGAEQFQAPAAPESPAASPEAAPVAAAPADPTVSNADEAKDALIAEARALGIKATRNWGIEKLQEEIAAVKGN
jgi:hypothetical protein